MFLHACPHWKEFLSMRIRINSGISREGVTALQMSRRRYDYRFLIGFNSLIRTQLSRTSSSFLRNFFFEILLIVSFPRSLFGSFCRLKTKILRNGHWVTTWSTQRDPDGYLSCTVIPHRASESGRPHRERRVCEGHVSKRVHFDCRSKG